MTISTLVLLALAAVWAVVLAPEFLRRAGSLRTGDSVSTFARQLSSIGRNVATRRPDAGRAFGQGLANIPPARSAEVVDLRSRQTAAPASTPSPAVRRRRQEVIGGLVAAAVLTLLCTIAFGGAFIVVHLLVDALLVAYLYLLFRLVSGTPGRAATGAMSGERSLEHRTTPVIDLTARPSVAAALYDPYDDAGLAITRVTPIPARRAAN
jgi:hypothetical protein